MGETNWLAAIIFYLLFIVGILVLVVMPGVKEGSLSKTLMRAALFGLITYATYDLTNLATIKDWPLLITIVDMILGYGIKSNGQPGKFLYCQVVE